MSLVLTIRKDRIKKNNHAMLFYRYTFKRERFYFKTNVEINIKYFDFEKGEIKRTFYNYDSDLFKKYNQLLSDFKKKLERTIIDLQIINVIPTTENVRISFASPIIQPNNDELITRIKEAIPHDIKKKSEPKQKYDFFKVYDEYLDIKESTKVYKARTVVLYNNTRKRLKDFTNSTKYPITFASINENFYNEFISYLYDIKNLTDNSVGTSIKHIKAFMKATYNKQHNNDAYRAFKKPVREGEVIVLEHQEIIQILEYKPKNEKEDKLKDCMIMQLGTALRISDLKALKSSNFDVNFALNNERLTRKRAQLKINVEKTEQKLRIPLNNMIFDLVKKYNIPKKEITFNKFDSKVYNKFIQQVCEECEIDRPIIRTMYRGHEKIEKTYKKYELITSHSFRKSFISYALKSNESAQVMAISGHKSWAAFKRYVNLADDTIKEVTDVLNNPYNLSKNE